MDANAKHDGSYLKILINGNNFNGYAMNKTRHG